VQDSGVALSKEGYSLNWLGKSYARLLANENIRTRLVADTAHNENPANASSKNLLIKGDNLEVLKHLMGAYSEQVKMIYIDPPYNTGSDGFVYQDDRKFSVEQLSSLAGIDEDEARRILEFTSSSSNSHSAWLTFMYPRLYLAKQLLRDDGVIFISIDDNEQAQLKVLCDEVFGEENFRNVFTLKRYDKNINRQFMHEGLASFNTGFEYVLCYSKSPIFKFSPVFRDASEDRQANGYWKGFWNDADRPTMRYEIAGFKPDAGQWKWSRDKADEAVGNYQKYEAEFSKKISLEDYWKETGEILKFIRRNMSGKGKNMGVEHWIPPSEGVLRNTSWQDIFASKTSEEVKGLFDFPKNPEAIKLMLSSIFESDNDIILDFFAGSGTSAHAVMQLNAEDGGNRQFICVQIDEATDPKSEAYKAGYKTIFDITQARISKAAAKIKAENPLFAGDVGFKIFATQPMFDKYLDTPESLTKNLELFDVKTLSQPDRHSLMLTWAVRDGIKLGVALSPVILGGYTAYAADKILYFIEPDISLTAVVALLEQLDNNPAFAPSRLVVLGYLLDSKTQREMTEAVKGYNNRKGIELTLDIRYN